MICQRQHEELRERERARTYAVRGPQPFIQHGRASSFGASTSSHLQAIGTMYYEQLDSEEDPKKDYEEDLEEDPKEDPEEDLEEDLEEDSESSDE